MDAEAGNKYRAGRGGGIGEGNDEGQRGGGGGGGGLLRSDAGNNKLIAGGEGEEKIWRNRGRKRGEWGWWR